ncbi:MAG: hypothetical protein WB424_07145 [Terracidiphilus sp.]
MHRNHFYLLLLAFVCASASRADHLDKVSNRSSAPVAVVDIEDDAHQVVGHLFVPPGETMLLDSDQNPAGGAGYYQATQGQDYLLIIPARLQPPHLGSDGCPCSLHMDKIGWNRQGAVAAIDGLKPFLETTSGAIIPIVSDVKHLNLSDGRLNFQLQGHGEYWVRTRYGQVVETGGPWGLWEVVKFFFADILPWLVLLLLLLSAVGAVRLMRQETHPDKSFLELMKVSLLSLLLRGKFGGANPE